MINTTTNLNFKIVAKTYDTTMAVSTKAISQSRAVSNFQRLTSSQISSLQAKGVNVPVNNKITVNNTTSVASSVANSGTASETTTYTISGIVPYNEEFVVCGIVVTAGSNKKIETTPNISIASVLRGTTLNENIDFKLSLQSVTRDSNNNPTSYNFNLLFKTSNKIIDSDNLILNFNYTQQPIITRSLEITNLIFSGGTSVKTNGRHQKNISVYGVPTTPFEVTFSDGDENNILDSTLTTSTVEGATPSINTTIPSNGVYSFVQEFPRIKLVRATAVNGSFSDGATKIVFDSLTDVAVGDELFTGSMTQSEPIKVTVLNPDGTNVNECSLSSGVTWVDDAAVEFRRATNYNFNLTSTEAINSSVSPSVTIAQPSSALLRVYGLIAGPGSINGGGVYYESFHPLPIGGSKSIDFTFTVTGKTWTQADYWNRPIVSYNNGLAFAGSSNSPYRFLYPTNIMSYSATNAEHAGDLSKISMTNLTSTGNGTATYVLSFTLNFTDTPPNDAVFEMVWSGIIT